MIFRTVSCFHSSVPQWFFPSGRPPLLGLVALCSMQAGCATGLFQTMPDRVALLADITPTTSCEEECGPDWPIEQPAARNETAPPSNGDVFRADVPLTQPNSPITFGNRVSEISEIRVPLGYYRLDVMDTWRVGNTELWDIVRDRFDADHNDNDITQVLLEIANGRSGAYFDDEYKPGVSGVDLLYISDCRLTLMFRRHWPILRITKEYDVLTFTGPGVVTAIAEARAEAALRRKGAERIANTPATR